MKHFLLVANQEKEQAVALAERVRLRLMDLGCCPERELSALTEAVLVFGGDGTLLSWVRKLGDRQLPFLGFNVGTLGYLAEVDPDHTEEALTILTSEDVNCERRMMLSGQVVRGGQTLCDDVALNDIVIGGHDLSVLHFRVYVDGEYLTTYQADGMVVSTPTGSTAYNLSAGGPVVDPTASLILLTPVAPHTLICRSIVLDADSVIELEIIDHPNRQGVEGCISFDGEGGVTLRTGDWVRILRSGRTTDIIRLNKVSFLETLRRKMADR